AALGICAAFTVGAAGAAFAVRAACTARAGTPGTGRRGGRARSAAVVGLTLTVLVSAGCARPAAAPGGGTRPTAPGTAVTSRPATTRPETPGAATPPAAPGAAAAVNDVDVMFLQMGLTQISEGDRVAALAEQRATDPRIRGIATELRGQWRTERGMMRRWLLGWAEPVTADPSAGAHAGHGDLHALRASDLQQLAAARGADFDRTAVSLLLGSLHNGMATLRMEAAGGAYPPARSLAARMAVDRQSQIQRLLRLAA
ncbi:DUF305 domain-containing protein, partial [Actinoplanes teichomyceticus]